VDQDAFLYRLVHYSTLPRLGDAPAPNRASEPLRSLPAH
jgi:hypothetical protein